MDAGRVLKMVLIHDLVEIDAGDTFLYDAEHAESKREREIAAADRIFSLLPTDQGSRVPCVMGGIRSPRNTGGEICSMP
ncbi:MAG: HD domain-containing protein [Desulfobacterales bacterium]